LLNSSLLASQQLQQQQQQQQNSKALNPLLFNPLFNQMSQNLSLNDLNAQQQVFPVIAQSKFYFY